MKMNDKLSEYLLNNKNPYQFKIGEMTVRMEYSKNGKSFADCMVNILKQKLKGK